ncbi:MAG: alpha/beta hydrolase [Aquabacterium sp.]|nr:MAG: alpha/beta hydrolase [Aquabacterium sp.]
MGAVLQKTNPPAAAMLPRIRHVQPPSGALESTAALLLELSLRLFFKPLIGPPLPVGGQRAVMHALSCLMPPALGVEVRKTSIATPAGALPTERLRTRGTQPRRAILFLHGGAFCVGSPRSHRSITTRLARLTGAEVVAPHYRRTPEAPFPAQIDDGVAAYRQLLADGYAPSQIALVGDSAGGTLSLLVPQALHQLGLPQPAALVLISPAVDLQGTGASRQQRASRDPMLRNGWVHQAMAWYAAPAGHPQANPLSQDYTSLPPSLVQVGTEEILYDDALLFTKRASAGGATVELEICERRWHVFQIHAGLLPGSTRALERQAEFLLRHWRD